MYCQETTKAFLDYALTTQLYKIVDFFLDPEAKVDFEFAGTIPS